MQRHFAQWKKSFVPITTDSQVAGFGMQDILRGFHNFPLALFLAWSDIRQRYRRSTLGPLWITISTGVMIGCLGLIFGNIFKAPREIFLPFLSVGLIVWSFISSVLMGATSVFADSEGVVKQLPLPLFTHVLRMILRNIIIFFHNLVLIPIVFFCVGKGLSWDVFLFIPGFLLLSLNLAWVALLLGVVCTRFRDITQIIGSILQIAFYVTPIIWLPTMLPGRAAVYVLEPNPFFHLLEIVRGPWLGDAPTYISWLYVVVMLVAGWVFTIVIYNRYKTRIAYWL